MHKLWQRMMRRFGADVIMTSESCRNGTERCNEALEKLEKKYDIIVNIQGDGPLIEPEIIDGNVKALRGAPDAVFRTAVASLKPEDSTDPNRVKCIVDNHGYAIYFSRRLIPFNKSGEVNPIPYLLHLGIQSYDSKFLKIYSELAPTPLQLEEDLEQLKVLENGYKMKKIDQGEEEMAKQSGMESGATEEQHDKVCERHQGEEEMANQSGATEEQHNNDRICEHLPEELIIESILTRLPVRTLAVCSCVRKYWYNSIHNDLRFSAIHYNQNKNKPSLVFHLLNVSREGRPGRAYCFSFLELEKACPDIRILLNLDFANLYEVVGFCNGLACFKVANAPDYTQGYITVINQSRAEIFVLNYLRPAGGYLFLGHGFGFDSLSQVYKVVIVFTSKGNDELLCMIVTLGTMSWRKILTSIVDISPPPGSSPFPSPMVTRVSRTLCRQATFCRGDLFWRTKSTFGSINDMEMLLSFDLHDEKIHFIQLPTECTMTLPSTTERQYLADDHLLEFKGYPCIARSERITTLSNNDHSGHCCNYRAGLCCCCYKVHMYILKDKDKQVWTREETFDVQIMDHKGSQPTPLCCLIKTRTPFYRRFNTSVPTPRTRLLTFSGQVLLYWFNGERLILYNLQEKYLKAVECSRTYPSIFQTKMNEDLERLIGDDDNIYCPSMDYQLHAQVENIVSLETFIPKEAKISECNSAKLQHLYENNLITGWLTLRRKRIAYAFS